MKKKRQALQVLSLLTYFVVTNYESFNLYTYSSRRYLVYLSYITYNTLANPTSYATTLLASINEPDKEKKAKEAKDRAIL